MADSAHIDRFCADNLPPREQWPQIIFDDVPEFRYPGQFNVAAELLDRNITAGRGERPVFHFNGEQWTYSQLLARANQIAHVLVDDLKLVPGNRVLLRGPNNPMMAACWFGVLKAGGVVVATMPLLRQRELAPIIEKAQIDIALTDFRLVDDCSAALGCRNNARSLGFGNEQGDSLEARMSRKPTTFANLATSADDVAIIAFTSGTTGNCKGTMHTHRDVLAAADCFSTFVVRPNENDTFAGTPPLAFTYALGGLVLFPMRHGASTLFVEQPTPPSLLEAIQKYRPTIIFTSPTGYRAMLPKLKDFDISSLRKCVSAGEHLPAATFDAWLAATGIRIIDGIGSTEMLHMFIGSPEEENKSGATGKIVRGYRAKVVDDNGDEVSRGTVGRLAVIGPTGCKYLNSPENQQKYVQNGWNFTGDSYIQDADGYFWYHARTDDMIISSGYNISGPEVENALLEHPAVGECAVVAAPDEARGNIVKAFIVLKPDYASADRATSLDHAALIKELQEFVKKTIAPYKYPRAIEFVSALPRTQTGKLQRFLLRSSKVKGLASQLPNYPITKLPDPPMPEHNIISVADWPVPSGYANAVSATGRVLTLAGQVGWDPKTCQFATDDFATQTAQALRNIVAILRAGGAEPQHVTRFTWFITDRDEYMNARREIGKAYREIFGKHFPAMSVVIVSGLIEPRAKVEIEATAVVAESP
jgi:2-aminobenzoate-CoA ligase